MMILISGRTLIGMSFFSPQGGREKPPSGAQNRYAIRLADQSKVSPDFAGWDRLEIAVYSLQFFVVIC